MIKKINSVLIIIISVTLILFSTLCNTDTTTSVIEILKVFFLTSCYLATIVFLWQNKYTRVISLLLIMFWITDASISLLFVQMFSSSLNLPLAMTILSTNFDEAKDFVLSNPYLFLFIVFLLLVICFFIKKLPCILSIKKLGILSLIMLVIVGYKVSSAALKYQSNNSYALADIAEEVLPYMALNNFGKFIKAYQQVNLLNLNMSPIYQLDVNDSGIDIYVIVIGESARRDHFSLYGYSRPTTPYIEKQKDNLFIFEQAIAPAPITIMSLASVLTINSSENIDYNLIGDNFLNLANQANFKTYWFSKQDSMTLFDSVVTGIAQSAQVKEWLKQGYDDSLLIKLDEALADKGTKKLIVLHTIGSHISACNKYPKEATYFTKGQSDYEDCYDNSIRFTDKLLGNIIQRLQNKSASLLYFSDHGQQKVLTDNNYSYMHGSINPSKESVDVPQFIWYSTTIDDSKKKLGYYLPPYSTSHNYYLIADWLGINKINETITSSPLSDSYIPQEKIMIMDTASHLFEYNQLQSDIKTY